MNALHVELPPELSSELERLGLTDDARVSAWVVDAVRRKLSSDKQLLVLEDRAARGNRDAFLRSLDKVPAVEPAEHDRISVGPNS